MAENINPFHPDNQRKQGYKIIPHNKRNFINVAIVLGCGIITYAIKPVPIGYLLIAMAFGVLGFLVLVWDVFSPMKWKTSLGIIFMAVLQSDMADLFKLREVHDPIFKNLVYLPVYFAAYCLIYLLLKIIFRRLLNRIIELKTKRQG